MEERLNFFKMAKELNEQHKELFATEGEEAHLRGNIKSMSLISLSKDRPELGFSNLTTGRTIEDKLLRLKTKELGRSTPEKELQAWMIRTALKNENHFLPFENEIKFLTSEMALYENEKRVVNDILGFKDGKLYVIELKSDRNMQRLIEQVENFEKIIVNNKVFFKEFCELYDCLWNEESIIKVIVWPFKNNPKTSQNLKDKMIIEFGYEAIGDGSFSIIKI